ncbi:unnamed protein product [Polarella glacialis]|uniref:Uncharacterized protein n=1 Tax=Polarella glacialis TaxID=89957 RepID=A0A813DNV8_POLGL|nr:unnamed protein product [Polarella glacialis]
MINTKFGVTLAFLEQLHSRMLREHVSFAGEADVAKATGWRLGRGDLLPARLRLYLSEACFFWPLVTRLCEVEQGEVGIARSAEVDFLQSVETALRGTCATVERHFEQSTVSKVTAAGLQTDVQVIDGNAKNRRSVCAALLRRKIACPRLQRSVRVNCPCTPILGSKVCYAHAAAAADVGAETGYEIVGREALGAVGLANEGPLRLKIRGVGEEGRELWVNEDLVHPGLVAAYFKPVGEDRLACLAEKKMRRIRARKTWTEAVGRAMGSSAADD